MGAVLEGQMFLLFFKGSKTLLFMKSKEHILFDEILLLQKFHDILGKVVKRTKISP